MYDELKRYSKEITSFHMPGHKGGKIQLMDQVYALDVTEVEGLDDLHHPTGMIQQVNITLREIFGSGYSTMLINGSTAGILAAISGCIEPKSSVAIARNCHKAVYHGVMLNQLEASYIIPTYEVHQGFYGWIEPDAVLTALSSSLVPIKAVIITSPTYEGAVSDIQAISRIVHDFGALLIVDEAHGAHFAFSSSLPTSAIKLGADVVIQSAHKTLPCLTQTAFLHVSQDAIETQRVNVHEIQRRLSLFQTSSPSYVLMSSIEKGIEYMCQHASEFDNRIKKLIDYQQKYRSSYGYWLYSKPTTVTRDPMRLTFVITQSSLTGWELNHLLRVEHNLQVELAGPKHIVAICTLADEFDDILRLGEAIDLILRDKTGSVGNTGSVGKTGSAGNVSNTCNAEESQQLLPWINKVYSSNQVDHISMYQAYHTRGKKVKLSESEGGICVDFIIPYPPGIPLLVPGEKMTFEKIQYIEYLMKNGMEVYGIIEGEVVTQHI